MVADMHLTSLFQMDTRLIAVFIKIDYVTALRRFLRNAFVAHIEMRLSLDALAHRMQFFKAAQSLL